MNFVDVDLDIPSDLHAELIEIARAASTDVKTVVQVILVLEARKYRAEESEKKPKKPAKRKKNV